MAELADLLKAAWRSRFGSPIRITGGVPPYQPQRKDQGVNTLLQDFWNAWRRLLREPRAAVGSVLLLALAIGVTSAMFAVIDAFIVRPAPFRDPGTLAKLDVMVGAEYGRVDLATIRAWRNSGVFESVQGVGMNAVGEFDGATGPVIRSGARITPGTFAMLGVSPMLGREFVIGEGREGNDRYVILSEPAWRELFNADPAIVGKTVEISKESIVVVGVMPPGLRFPHRGNGIWRPLDLDAPSARAARGQVLAFARRKATIPADETARLASDAIAPLSPKPSTTKLRPAAAGLLDDYSRESLLALVAGVGLVFLVLCANVANLILARTTARRREFGVCSALGASRGRLLRQVLLENTAIGVCATVLGLGLAYALVAIGQSALPEDLLWRTLNPLDLDLRAVLATSAAGMVAVLLAGLPAAWLGTRGDVIETVRLASRGGTDTPGSRRATQALLVVEVAMAVALLASAGLQVRSFVNLTSADRGLDADNVLIAKMTLPPAQFADRASQSVTSSLIQERLGALPGVDKVTLASNLPPNTGDLHFSFDVQTTLPGAAPVRINMMHSYSVAPAFFDVFGIQIKQGRGFEVTDDAGAAVLSENLAHALFGDVSPVGQTFSFGKTTYHVVGIATEIRNSLTDPREDYPEFYSPWYRAAAPGAAASAPVSSSVTVGLHCADPCASVESVRQAIASISAGIVVRSIEPLSKDFLEQLSWPRVAAAVATSFAGLALFATAAGLYGVLAYVVSRRRREFGIRAALGAAPRALRRSVLADGMRVSVAGVALGVAAGWGLSRWLASVQFGVSFFDPLTWLVVISAVLVIALLSSWRPATDAMRVDPSEMLREP
jgi:putative ABC transport system permease protein